MVSDMKCFIFTFGLLLVSLGGVKAELQEEIERGYEAWREAMITKDARGWMQATAPHRQREVRNRIVSEKKPFPGALFNIPAPPPALDGLKFLSAKRNGRTAKAAYFGKIDFGVGGNPTDNLLVLSMVSGSRGWLYDRANYVNLTALPEVRKELAEGNLQYLEGVPEAQPTGVVPPTPIAVQPATTIAKVYVFCPGREVQVQVNKVSRHRFANAKEAEIVWGGARRGPNEVQYAVKPLEGGTGKEALAIRIYLMSEVEGMKPIKAFEYVVKPGEQVKSFDTGTFQLSDAVAAKLSGRAR